jgi:putative SOS response-associated peptidase YedK
MTTRRSLIMCGRAKLPDDVSEIKLDLKIDFDEIGDYRPRWNAAPTSKLPVVVSRNGERTQTLMRWGLVPSWAQPETKSLKIGYSTFNARADGIDTRPAFRTAWKAGQRCLVIVDGYCEWCDTDKQPFAVALGNRGPMTFAGLWDHWHAPDGGTLKSFAIVTTGANELLAPLHDRMPVLIPPGRWAAWLGEHRLGERPATDTELKAMLQP